MAALPTIPKHIIADKVQTNDNTVFTVQGVESSELDILVVFSSSVDYQVVKLNVVDLPTQEGITWINNFGVMDSAGKRYLSSVNYSVYLPPAAHANSIFVYADQQGVHQDKKTEPGGPKWPSKVRVDFATGDPEIGWK